MSLLGITYGAEVNGAKSPLRLNYFVALLLCMDVIFGGYASMLLVNDMPAYENGIRDHRPQHDVFSGNGFVPEKICKD